MNTEDLAEAVWDSLQQQESKVGIKEKVEKVFSIISEQLCKGEKVKVRNFGTFELKFFKSTNKLVPGRAERIEVPCQYRVSFFASPNLNREVSSSEINEKRLKNRS